MNGPSSSSNAPSDFFAYLKINRSLLSPLCLESRCEDEEKSWAGGCIFEALFALLLLLEVVVRCPSCIYPLLSRN